MNTVKIREPVPVSTSWRSSAAVRLIWLHARSRRVPSAAAVLAVIAVALWAVLTYHWTLEAHGGQDTTELPMIFEGCMAAVIAITTHSPFGEPERATGRSLLLLRLVFALVMCGLAIGLLALAAAIANAPGANLAGGTIPLIRNVLGMTGIGMILVLFTGGLLGWAGPLGYIAISEFALVASYSTPLTWPARPPGDRGGWIVAMIVFAVGLIAYTIRGARSRITDTA